jgi:foldase protein PrsA
VTRVLPRAGAALLAALVLAGCGPGDQPVARIGQRTITVDDFAYMARGNEASFPEDPEQGRTMFLEKVLEQEVLREQGRALGYDTLPAVRKVRAGLEESMLLQALQRDLGGSPAVSEAEARRLWVDRHAQVDAQIVFTFDEGSIRRAKAALDAGTPFSQLADRFNPPSMLPPGGVVSNVLPGTLPPGLDDGVRSLRPGQVGGPYASPQGWFLIKLTRRVPATPLPFELSRSTLEEILRQRKLRTTVINGVLALEQEYHARVLPGASQTLFRYLEPLRVGGAAQWVPDSAERLQPLATFDGGAYTLGDAATDLQRTDLQRPDPNFQPGLARWLQDRIGARVALAEARRRHLNEDPDFVRAIEARVGEFVIRSVYNEATAGTNQPPEPVARELWERIKAGNPQLKQARIAWVLVPDSTLLRGLLERHEAGQTLLAAAAAVSPRLAVRVETVRFPSSDPRWQAMQPSIATTPVGQWAEPQFIGSGWQAMQVLDKTQDIVAWEGLTDETRTEILGRVQSMQREMRLSAYRDSVVRVLHPVTMPENLRLVGWPVPPRIDLGT